MEEGNRFWNPIRASSPAHLRVTLRARGDIPGCTPAVDVFVEDKTGKITIRNPAEPSKLNYYLS